MGKEGSDDAELEDLRIVRSYFEFLAGLVLDPEFKHMIGWPSLGIDDIELGERTLSLKSVKNFVTLVAIKIQNLTNELNLCKTRIGCSKTLEM